LPPAAALSGPARPSPTLLRTGWNLTNVVIYSGWANYDRDGQFYIMSYALWRPRPRLFPWRPSIRPANLGGPAANRVAIARLDGTPLASLVAAVKFDFATQSGPGLDNGYSGYAEIVLQGSNLPPPTPPTFRSPFVSSGNLILTGVGGTPTGLYPGDHDHAATPLVNWTVSTTGTLDGSGAFSNAIPISVTNQGSFFRLRMP